MIYSFACPAPCHRKIEVDACHPRDAIEKAIFAGALSCRNGDFRCICVEARLNMPAIPWEQLRSIVGLGIREGKMAFQAEDHNSVDVLYQNDPQNGRRHDHYEVEKTASNVWTKLASCP